MTVAAYAIFFVYTIALIYITVYCLMQFNLLYFYKKHHWRERAFEEKLPEIPDRELPFVTIQLPIFNELYVVERLIDNITQLDYPKDRFEIHVLDDSTDETIEITRRKVEQYQAKGFQIQQIRRKDRKGYKAGALKDAMQYANGDFIAIFDADFLPRRNFLKATIPHFSNEKVGVVQTRWEHINQNYSLITRLQALQLNVHFTIEQQGRKAANCMLQFNGTAGVWRREAIESAGGWQSDTLTEDFDLSYRAQLAGWRIQMLPDLVAPAELPDTLPAYRRQQRRWAMGTVQVLRKLGRALLSADRPIPVRLLALLTLAGYLVHPVMLALLLGAPLLLIWPPVFPAGLSLLTLAPLCPPILYAVGLCRVEPGWR
ncbi:MAG: glycosyltransferase, partial [Phaeodactylibacter sp.]|nr:glycosyltransferase [Phaeodactylibacter sp.]